MICKYSKTNERRRQYFSRTQTAECDMKIESSKEIEILKKTQTEMMLEMRNTKLELKACPIK